MVFLLVNKKQTGIVIPNIRDVHVSQQFCCFIVFVDDKNVFSSYKRKTSFVVLNDIRDQIRRYYENTQIK